MSLNASHNARVSFEALPCSLVNSVARGTEEQCKFILDNDCLESEATLDYVYMVFCWLGYEQRVPAIGLVIFLLVVLFLNLSAVADEFLCPSLLTVAKNLRMSDSLAGVTLLAFGNGCPDIFASLAAASSGRPELIIGELLGAGIFCTSIVAGLIFISSEFKIARRPLLRDTSFYLMSIYLIWLFCSEGAVSFYGAIGFILIYVIYLLVALMGQAIHARLRGEYSIADPINLATEKKSPDRDDTKSTDNPTDMDEDDTTEKEMIYKRLEELIRRRSSGVLDSRALHAICQRRDNASPPAKTVPSTNRDKPEATTDAITMTAAPVFVDHNNNQIVSESVPSNYQKQDCAELSCKQANSSSISEQARTTKKANDEARIGPGAILDKIEGLVWIDQHSDQKRDQKVDGSESFDLNEFDHFLYHVNPVDTINWSESSSPIKLMSLLRAPLLLLTILSVPVVDQEKPQRNWCRLLNSIHCFTIPVAVVALTNLKWGSKPWFTSPDDASLDRYFDNNNLSATEEHSFEISRDLVDSELGGNSDDILMWYSKFLVFLPGLLLALYVFNTTSAIHPPKYHPIYAYFGFVMSVIWIYKLANEIISLLKTVGIIFSMSDTAIGLGFLAWGNSLGDIVANLTLAHAGYARMALGASIGAPLLNLLLGFGLSFAFSLKPGQSVSIQYNDTMTLLAGTLAFILVLLMASVLIASNRSKKPLGYLLITCYGLYFTLAVCLEYDLI